VEDEKGGVGEEREEVKEEKDQVVDLMSMISRRHAAILETRKGGRRKGVKGRGDVGGHEEEKGRKWGRERL
jgi:hypothetical protein